MAIRVTCPSCGRQAAVADELAGRTGRCKCGAEVVVPSVRLDAASSDRQAHPFPADAIAEDAAVLPPEPPEQTDEAGPGAEPDKPRVSALRPVKDFTRLLGAALGVLGLLVLPPLLMAGLGVHLGPEARKMIGVTAMVVLVVLPVMALTLYACVGRDAQTAIERSLKRHLDALRRRRPVVVTDLDRCDAHGWPAPPDFEAPPPPEGRVASPPIDRVPRAIGAYGIDQIAWSSMHRCHVREDEGEALPEGELIQPGQSVLVGCINPGMGCAMLGLSLFHCATSAAARSAEGTHWRHDYLDIYGSGGELIDSLLLRTEAGSRQYAVEIQRMVEQACWASQHGSPPPAHADPPTDKR